MAPQPSAPAPQPPPDLPSMPDASPALTGYLRTFALWCRNMFQDRLPAHAALPGVMLLATDTASSNPPVYMLGVTSAGQATLAPMALGSGDIGAAAPIGGGATGPAGPAGPPGPNTLPPGVTNGSDAAAGQIGEVISYVRVQASALPLTSNTNANIGSISLTPGDWDVQGEVWIAPGTGAPTVAQGGINTSVALALAGMGTARSTISGTLAASSGTFLGLSPCRANLTAATTYYLVAQATFPSGATTAYGKIWARRMR